MTPPPAASAAARLPAGRRAPAQPGHRRTLHRSLAPRAARRISGPSPAAGGIGAPALPRIDLRLPRLSPAAITRRIGLGGFVGGRMWIGVFAGLLLGLVFLQVSLLKLNSGISLNVERAQALERDNAALRGSLSQLDAGQRIQDVAGALGMVMPGAGAVCYLDARTRGACSGGDAAAASTATDPAQTTAPPPPTGAAVVDTGQPSAQSTGTTTPATTTTSAPAATQPQGATQGPATQTQAPAPAQTQGAAAPTATQAPAGAPATTANGGVSAPVGG
ncbi:MAG TPA: hypothetical protein VII98_14190 [Solirubrobacteraceae bacterium]